VGHPRTRDPKFFVREQEGRYGWATCPSWRRWGTRRILIATSQFYSAISDF
jgi:hypothetical protein